MTMGPIHPAGEKFKHPERPEEQGLQRKKGGIIKGKAEAPEEESTILKTLKELGTAIATYKADLTTMQTGGALMGGRSPLADLAKIRNAATNLGKKVVESNSKEWGISLKEQEEFLSDIGTKVSEEKGASEKTKLDTSYENLKEAIKNPSGRDEEERKMNVQEKIAGLLSVVQGLKRPK